MAAEDAEFDSLGLEELSSPEEIVHRPLPRVHTHSVTMQPLLANVPAPSQFLNMQTGQGSNSGQRHPQPMLAPSQLIQPSMY